MPPQVRAAFNWGLLVQVGAWLISMGVGAVLVIQEQKTQQALDHQEITQLMEVVKEVRSNQLSAGVYDVKLLNLQNGIADLREDLKIEKLQREKDHNQLLVRRLVQP